MELNQNTIMTVDTGQLSTLNRKSTLESRVYNLEVLNSSKKPLQISQISNNNIPNDKSVVQEPNQMEWNDKAMAIYEVHLGSWRRAPGDRMLSYLELAEQLVERVFAARRRAGSAPRIKRGTRHTDGRRTHAPS